ncbi:MAG: GNAT family N-acetyltransferase [Bacteroidetes bacterium]|nr:MAG: GNAT family N-acetyltransferase [Bacteroidota bacterium]
MLKIHRTNSSNPQFLLLVNDLNAELAVRDGEEYSFYAQFNKVDKINHVVVAYWDDLPVGCGAIKAFDEESMEVKRMFVHPEFRGRGIASSVLEELESWTRELGFNKCVLETGKKQPEAIGLYSKSGYNIIPNFGQYAGVENSVCFEKKL